MKKRFRGGIAHRPIRRSLVAGAAAALWACMPAGHAVELGVLHLHSNIGQPLDAEIDLTGLRPHDAQALVLQPGNRETYLAASVPYGASATSLRTTLVQRQDGYVVRVYSTVPQVDSIADIVVRLAGPGGDTLAAYTLLLSPPGTASAPTTFLQTQRKPAPASGVSAPSAAPAQRAQTQAAAGASTPAVHATASTQPGQSGRQPLTDRAQHRPGSGGRFCRAGRAGALPEQSARLHCWKHQRPARRRSATHATGRGNNRGGKR